MADEVELTPNERVVATECVLMLDLCEAAVARTALGLGIPEYLLWRMVRDLAVKHARETH